MGKNEIRESIPLRKSNNKVYRDYDIPEHLICISSSAEEHISELARQIGELHKRISNLNSERLTFQDPKTEMNEECTEDIPSQPYSCSQTQQLKVLLTLKTEELVEKNAK